MKCSLLTRKRKYTFILTLIFLAHSTREIGMEKFIENNYVQNNYVQNNYVSLFIEKKYRNPFKNNVSERQEIYYLL